MMVKPHPSPRARHDESEQFKVNNNTIIAALKTLCEILKEHNKTFTRSSSDTNLSVGTVSHPNEEIEVHTCLINSVASVLKNIDRFPIGETKNMLLSSLDISVISHVC